LTKASPDLKRLYLIDQGSGFVLAKGAMIHMQQMA